MQKRLLFPTNHSLEVLVCLDHVAEQTSEESTPSPSSKEKRRRRKKNKGKNGEVAKLKVTTEGDGRSKQLRKCSTFPSSEPVAIPSVNRKALEYEDAHSVSPASLEPLSSSCPSSFSLRSALRGGQEGLGLGPRPKLHVKWASDVHDPPSSIVSHTVVDYRNSRKKKHEKKQKKNKSKSKGAKSKVENVVVEMDNPDSPKPTQDDLASSFFATMEQAMQHMLLASKSINKSDLSGALAEYKAASRVFRMAKLDAEGKGSDSSNHRELAVKQAIRGQVLAWIAMATLYSADGQLSKCKKCQELAFEACQEFKDGVHSTNGLGNESNCGLAALSSARACVSTEGII